MDFGNVDYCHFVASAKVLGVHRQKNSRIHHYFIIAVVWNDKSQVTVYRKWKQIARFQRELHRSLKRGKENYESRRYLKRTARRVRDVAQSSTMGKLKMIDSLNDFFAAATHYKELAQSQNVRQFFKPNANDMAAISWSITGKTYIYVPKDLLGDYNEIDGNIHSSVDCKNTCVVTTRFDSVGKDWHVSDKECDSQDLCVSSTQSATFIALADFEGNGQGAIPIRKDDEIEVIETHESGWWLARKQTENIESYASQIYGYVPAGYLSSRSCGSVETSTDGDSNHNRNIGSQTDILNNRRLQQNHAGNMESDSSPTLSAPDMSRNESNSSIRLSTYSHYSVCSSPGQPPRSEEMENMAGKSPRSYSADLEQKHYSTPRYTAAFDIATLEKSASVPSPDLSRRIHIGYGHGCSMSTGNISIQTKGVEYICTTSYKATSTEEISYEKGSILKVHSRNSNGWWLATYKGKIGLVPGVHLQKYRDPIKRLSRLWI